MRKLRCNQRGLWDGPVYVNGNEYRINSEGRVEVSEEADANKLLSFMGWSELAPPPAQSKRTTVKPSRAKLKKAPVQKSVKSDEKED